MELMQAHRQWASRPADERFVDLPSMYTHALAMQENSRPLVVANRGIEAIAKGSHDLVFALSTETGSNAVEVGVNNYAFGQLAQLASAPAGYLRTLPAPLAAVNINYGLHAKREVENVGTLLTRAPDGNVTLRAATGPNYGRIWNAEVIWSIMQLVGDGIAGQWRVPGEWGKAVAVTQANTTLYLGNELFTFLVDEVNRVENPNRRNGQAGTLARGWFASNSEIGSGVLELDSFLFDFVCGNRIVWGAEGFQRIRIRHSAAAPFRWREELLPALTSFLNGDNHGIEDALKSVKARRLGDATDAFLAKHFGGPKMADKLKMVHLAEEGRPIETAWDVVTAATAHARAIPFQDERVALERIAGDVFGMFADKPRKRELVLIDA